MKIHHLHHPKHGGLGYYGLYGLFIDLGRSRLLKYLAYASLVFILFMLTKKLFIFSLFVIFTGIIIYYTKLMHFPIDVSPLFFLEIVITKYYGIAYTILFILLAYIIPKTIAGQSMNWMSYVFISISMFSNLFVLIFPAMPLQTVGYLTSIIQYIGGVIFQSSFKPFFLSAADGFAYVLNNLLWFLIFSEVIVMVF